MYFAEADPRLSMGSGQPQRGTLTYYLVKIFRKLHDNEDNWTDRGGASKILLLITKLFLICFSIFMPSTSADICKLLYLIFFCAEICNGNKIGSLDFYGQNPMMVGCA